MSEQQVYDKPMTFVNTKRVRTGDKTKNGADKTTLTFGITKNFKTGAEENTLDLLIAALEQYRGKQVNLTVFVQDKQSEDGRTFKSSYVGVTEMIPRDQAPQGMKNTFVPKNVAKQESIKARAEKLADQFKG